MKVNKGDKMIKMGYKVVNRNLRSATVANEGAVIYKVNESVYPKIGCGPLTVFKDKFAAAHFTTHLLFPSKIFRCFYIPSYAQEVWYLFDSYREDKIRVSLWALMADNYDCLIPNSVDLACEVVLVEEV